MNNVMNVETKKAPATGEKQGLNLQDKSKENLKHEPNTFERIDSNDIIYHLDEMEKGIYISQTTFNRSLSFVRILDGFLEDISKIKNLISINQRFEWKAIQNEMDRVYKIDSNLTGYTILFDFKESAFPNRARISVNLFNQ